jgi:PPOX class probable F420-dependent enzyme
MSAEDRIYAFAASRNLGSLATLKRDGRPQLSNVAYTFDPQTRIARVSVTDDRAKTRNVRRDPRVSMLVSSQDGWSNVVLEGDAELSAVATQPNDATVEELVDIYRKVGGSEHPDWDDFRRAMVADRRLVLSLQVTHVYGAPPGA